MAAIETDYILFKNRYNALKFTVDGVENLSGWSARWTMAPVAGDPTVIDKSDEDDIEIIGVDVYVDIWPADTSSLTGQVYYQELTLEDTEGNQRVASYADTILLRETSDIS